VKTVSSIYEQYQETTTVAKRVETLTRSVESHRSRERNVSTIFEECSSRFVSETERQGTENDLRRCRDILDEFDGFISDLKGNNSESIWGRRKASKLLARRERETQANEKTFESTLNNVDNMLNQCVSYSLLCI